MIKAFINKILKGLNTDVDYSEFPNDSAYKLENAQIVNESGNDFVITTNEGNEKTFSLDKGLIPIDFKVYDGILYIVSYIEVNGNTYYEVGTYPSLKSLTFGGYINSDHTIATLVYDDSEQGLQNEYNPLPMAKYGSGFIGFTTKKIKFDKNYVNILPRKSYDKSVDLFICDGEHYNRTINTGFNNEKVLLDRLLDYDSTEEKHEKITRQFLSVNKPPHNNFEVEQGGNLRYGRLFFYIRYLDISFNPTNWFPLEGPVQIAYGSKYYDIHGGDPENDVPTDKQVKFELSNLDTAFTYFEIGVFYERGQASTTPPVKKAYKIANRYTVKESKTIYITGREDEENVTPEELINPMQQEQIGYSHDHHNKRYYGARWKRSEYDVDAMKELAKRFYLIPKTDSDHDDYSFESDFLLHEDHLIKNQYEKYPSAFYPGEVASFAVVALMDDGTFSKPYPITGYNNFYQYKYGTTNNLETCVANSNLPGNDDEKMKAWLSNDNNTNQGLVQFPMLGTAETLFEYLGLDKMTRPLVALLKTKYAREYFNNNISDFEGVKGFYLVRNNDFKNSEYMGFSYEGYDRFVIHSRTEMYGNISYFYISYGRTAYDEDNGIYVKDPDNGWALVESESEEPISSLYMPLHGGAGIPYGAAKDFEGVSSGIFTHNTGSVSIDRNGSKTSPFGDKRRNYGVFSMDFILNQNRPLNDNMSYIISKPFKSFFHTDVDHFCAVANIGYNIGFSGPDSTYPSDTGWYNYAFVVEHDDSLNGHNYWEVKEGTVVNVEKDTFSKYNFSSAAGDPLLTPDLKCFFNDKNSWAVLQDDVMRDYGVRNWEVRTSPYIGVKLNGPGWGWGDKELLLISKHSPVSLYDKILSEINDRENIKYFLCTKDIIFDGSSYLYNGDRNADIMVEGNAFLSRSFIRTRYNQLFKDLNFSESEMLPPPSGEVPDWASTAQQLRQIKLYNEFTHELLSLSSYTWNNVAMQSPAKKRFYPFGLKDNEDKHKYCAGLLRSEKDMGVDAVLDASYNRTVFPNEFLKYPNYYKEQFEFNGRVRYSDQHIEGSYYDTWRVLRYNDMQDFDLTFGIIIGILNVLGRLVLIHMDAIYQLFSDQRETKQSETGAELTIGVGGVLEKTRRPLTEKFGADIPEFTKGEVGAYGVSLRHGLLWQITNSEDGQLAVVNLTMKHQCEDGFKSIVSKLSDFVQDKGILGSGVRIGYSYDKKSIYVTVFNRKTQEKNVTIEENGLVRINSGWEDHDIMGREIIYAKFSDGYWRAGDVVEWHKEYVLVDFIAIPANTSKIEILKDGGKTYIYDEYRKYISESTNVPDHWISDDKLSSVKRDITDLNDPLNPVVKIYKHTSDARVLEYFGNGHEMRIGIVINAYQDKSGLNSVQKMFNSHKVTSCHRKFHRAVFETEYQTSMLFPFLNEERFWELPEYVENRWEFNVPLQQSNEDQGYEEDEAQLRGLWMKVELHYRDYLEEGDVKYIKDIITKALQSYA